MDRVKFNPQEELKVIGAYNVMGGKIVRFNTPVAPRENTLALYRREVPVWMPFAMGEINPVNTEIFPDHVCRTEKEGKDIFGIEWVYVPAVKGGIVRPGAPTVVDINRWEECVTLPDVDSWDWEGAGAQLKEKYDPTLITKTTILTGFFERLISFMDFQYAAMALIDDEQKEGVHRLFNYLCGIYEKMIDNCKKYFNVEVLCFHDDWGSQRDSFFSYDTCKEMIFPYIKRIVDYMHSKDIYFDFHCCGKVERLVPLMIEAGMDSWSGQDMNDKFALRERYGNRLIMAINPADLPADASDEACYAAAKAFIEKCGKTGGVQAALRPSASPAKLFEYVYALSREAYNS